MRPQNIDEPEIAVKHSELKRIGDSFYRSECPKCGGVLLVGRDNITFILQARDRCILCGQMFRYIDIDEMRKREGISLKPGG